MGTTGTINIIETFNVHCCTECGVSYALTAAFEDRRRDDHKTFHCPNGHRQHYPSKNDAEKAREEAERERQRAERLQQQLRRREEDLQSERRQHSATKGQLTKTRKRAAHGTCPCCKRSFANVQRHVSSQHPEYVETHG